MGRKGIRAGEGKSRSTQRRRAGLYRDLTDEERTKKLQAKWSNYTQHYNTYVKKVITPSQWLELAAKPVKGHSTKFVSKEDIEDRLQEQRIARWLLEAKCNENFQFTSVSKYGHVKRSPIFSYCISLDTPLNDEGMTLYDLIKEGDVTINED